MAPETGFGGRRGPGVEALTQPPSPAPYWPPLVVAGASISLAHLEPHGLDCPTTEAGLPNPLRINVVYGDHCFSEGYDPAKHPAGLLLPWTSPASRDRRAFSAARHALSHNLPCMVRSLPTARVNFTSEERNYVYFITLTAAAAAGGFYPMFFQIKRAVGEAARLGFHLELHVVSAYQPDRPIAVRREAIRFLVLASKVHRGEKPRPFRR